jgi:hypothetical protein
MELGGHLSKTLYTRVNDTLLCPFWASSSSVSAQQSPECQLASSSCQLSESILASTRIAGGGERRRQVKDSDHSWREVDHSLRWSLGGEQQSDRRWRARGAIAGSLRGERSQVEVSDRTWRVAIAHGGERSQVEGPGAIAGGGEPERSLWRRWRENQHSQTNTFQKPVFGNQKCRHPHDVRRSTGIRQAFRSSCFMGPAAGKQLARGPAGSGCRAFCKSCGDLRPGLVTWTRSGISLHAMYDM